MTPPVQVPKIVHGTDATYYWHHREKVPVCEPCRLAHNDVRAARGRVAAAKRREPVAQILHPETDDWQKAPCRTDPEAWYADDVGTLAQAREACHRWCPLREACLTDALAEERTEAGKPYGVRGGMTAAQRHLILRRERGAA